MRAPNGSEDNLLFTGTAGSFTLHLQAQERFGKPASLKRTSGLKASAKTEGESTSHLSWLFLPLSCSGEADKDHRAPTAELPWEGETKLGCSYVLPASLFVSSILDLPCSLLCLSQEHPRALPKEIDEFRHCIPSVTFKVLYA